MTTDLEERLREELSATAATTRTRPGALAEIIARAETRRPTPWWRPAVVVAFAAAVVVVGVAVMSSGGGSAPVVTDLPPAPPVMQGTVVADVHTSPCAGDCVDGTFRFSLEDPSALEQLGTGEFGGLQVLPDGRYVVPGAVGDGRSSLVDPAGGPAIDLGEGDVVSLDLRPDGGIVVLSIVDDARPGSVLREVNPVDGSIWDRSLPDDLVAQAVAVAPNGDVAVLGDRGECCLNRPELVVIGADGEERRLRFSIGDRLPPLVGKAALSWSSIGLVAISSDKPEPLAAGGEEHPGWTVVLDPATGAVVATLEGWQGLAWSPDGLGLLAARRDGRRASGLAVFWGPGLSRQIDVGRTDLPVVPRHWAR